MCFGVWQHIWLARIKSAILYVIFIIFKHCCELAGVFNLADALAVHAYT